MKDLMIDLETLGTDVDAPVLSIGAVFFDIEKKELGPKFYVVLDLDVQFTKGRRWGQMYFALNPGEGKNTKLGDVG